LTQHDFYSISKKFLLYFDKAKMQILSIKLEWLCFHLKQKSVLIMKCELSVRFLQILQITSVCETHLWIAFVMLIWKCVLWFLQSCGETPLHERKTRDCWKQRVRMTQLNTDITTSFILDTSFITNSSCVSSEKTPEITAVANTHTVQSWMLQSPHKHFCHSFSTNWFICRIFLICFQNW